MSTEPGRVESDSNAVFAANASRFENGLAHTFGTLADCLSSEAQDLEVKLVSASDDGTEKRNGFCYLKRKAISVDLETHRSETEKDSGADSAKNKSLDGSGKKVSDIGVVLASSDLLKSNDKNGLTSANENPKLFDSDLVWAKVRSYPWWPGQVFDASAASEQAMKYFKKGNFLVAFFGDFSFAWNDACKIKPLHQYFSQMQNQSDSVEFCNAIDCVLEEVARRVEFGLSCPCISNEVYNKLKTQNVINPGIREDSSIRFGGDMLSNAISFEPAKFVGYMKHLACLPSYDATEKLQFVSNRAQLMAFQQWKDYFHFPEYETTLRSVESASLEPNMDEETSSKKRETDCRDNDEHRQRFDSDLRIDEKTEDNSLSDGKSHSDKKRKVEFSDSSKSEKKIKNKHETEDSAEPCFRIGAIPLRMEIEMNSWAHTPMTCIDYNSITKVEVENKTKHEELGQRKISSPDEMSIPEFISIDPSNYKEFDQFLEAICSSKINDESKKPSFTETSESTDVKQQILPANKDITSSRLEEQPADSTAPTVLILNFAKPGSVPSKEKLNEIFNRYGPLRESETKVMKNGKRAKVVFKSGVDAKTAFSSAGKYRVFGPSLLSYRLMFPIKPNSATT